MRISVDQGVDRPIYIQIYRQIVDGIARGEISNGEPLSPIRSLAASLGVSPGTVARSYDLLAERRLTTSNRRGGTTVASDARRTAQDMWRAQLIDALKDALTSGVSPAAIRDCLDGFLPQRPGTECR